ncbi:MAG: hypothetical protein ILP04_03410 [Bacteroidales bacterium]|nr:hypothetical protein [Bacteroidales bacterium]
MLESFSPKIKRIIINSNTNVRAVSAILKFLQGLQDLIQKEGGAAVAMKKSGNQPTVFNVNLITAFKVEVNVAQIYTNENGGIVGGDVTIIELTKIQKDIIDSILSDAFIFMDQMAVKKQNLNIICVVGHIVVYLPSK